MRKKTVAFLLCLLLTLFPLAACKRVQKAEHTLVYVSARSATCTQDGVKEHWKCNDCGKCYADAEGKQERDDFSIPALGHEPTVARILRDSCDQPGEKRCICKRCGEEFCETVPAGEHYFRTFILVEATSEKAGEGVKICTLCGKSENVAIPARTEEN